MNRNFRKLPQDRTDEADPLLITGEEANRLAKLESIAEKFNLR